MQATGSGSEYIKMSLTDWTGPDTTSQSSDSALRIRVLSCRLDRCSESLCTATREKASVPLVVTKGSRVVSKEIKSPGELDRNRLAYSHART